jgi:hypothetical protein
MANISHTAAFKAQSDFAPESKIKVGNDIWAPETAGARLFAEVLSKNPGTVQKVIDKAAELDPPFTSKQVQGHLRWLYTAGELEVDGVSYVVQAKAPKAKPEPKAKEVKVGKYAARLKAKPKVKAEAAHQRRMVRTKRLKRAA